MDDDDDMADLYLSRKLSFASSASSDVGDFTWSPASPTIESKISRASRATPFSTHGENDVEELEMLLEVHFITKPIIFNWLHENWFLVLILFYIRRLTSCKLKQHQIN